MPPGARPAKTPEARSIQDLVRYTEETQFAPPVDAPGQIKDTVDAAWRVLGRQPHITEGQKDKIMTKVHHTMHAIEGDDTLMDLFSLPTTVSAPPPDAPKKTKQKLRSSL